MVIGLCDLHNVTISSRNKAHTSCSMGCHSQSHNIDNKLMPASLWLNHSDSFTLMWHVKVCRLCNAPLHQEIVKNCQNECSKVKFVLNTICFHMSPVCQTYVEDTRVIRSEKTSVAWFHTVISWRVSTDLACFVVISRAPSQWNHYWCFQHRHTDIPYFAE